MTVHLLVELGLDRLEQLPINDGRLLAGQDLTLECDLANVESVAEQMGERPAGERDASDGLSGLQYPYLGDDALVCAGPPSAD